MRRQGLSRRSPWSGSGLALLASICLAGAIAIFSPGEAWAQPSCGVRDWRCFLRTAAADVLKGTGESGDNRGRQLVELVKAYPSAERIAMAEQFLAAVGKDEDAQYRLENFLVPARLAATPDIALLRKALASGTSPEPDFALSEYARMAFKGLIDHGDTEAVLKLWRDEGRQLWRAAPQAELTIDAWLAETAPDLLNESIRSRGLVDGGWGAVSGVAGHLCRAGARDKGNALLALLDEERRSWSSNRSHDATNLASSVTAVAACNGIEAAEKRLDAAFAQMQSDVTAIRTHVADKDDAQATIDLLEQAVAETGVRPLVRALLDAGRTDDAMRVFGRLPQADQPAAVTIGTDGSPGDPDSQSGEGGWQSEYAGWAQARSFSDDPAQVLADVDRWEKEDDDNVAADAMAQMQRTAEALVTFKGVKRPYMLRLKVLGDRLAALPDGGASLPREQTEIMLATTEVQLSSCWPGDGQLQAWESAFIAAPDIETRVDGAALVARLLRQIEASAAGRTTRDPDYGACIVAKN